MVLYAIYGILIIFSKTYIIMHHIISHIAVMHLVNESIFVLLFLNVCILCQTPLHLSSHTCFHHISHTAGQHYEEGVIWLLEVL